MAEKITFNTGAKSYEIVDQDGNELGVFRFIPTDVGILNRYKETAAFFASVGDKIKGEDLEEILPELEKEAGEKIDFLFGAPVSENFFEITVIGGIIEKELAEREKKQQERIDKYTAKYTKKDEAK